MNFVATITWRISVVNFTLEYTRNQLESWLKHEVEFIYLTGYTLTSVQYLASPYSSLHISFGADKENLLNDHELLRLEIVPFVLMILLNDWSL